MMLVAYFLQYIYHFPFNRKLRLDNPLEVETLPLPGLIPTMLLKDRKSAINNLSYWIKRYQTAFYGKGDGRVDVGQNTLFTIFSLNRDFQHIIKRTFNQTDWIKFMLNDSPDLMPPSLKFEISVEL